MSMGLHFGLPELRYYVISTMATFYTTHFSILPIFHTPYFPDSLFSTLLIFPHSPFSILLIFHTPHFPYSSFSSLLIFHTLHFPFFALCTPNICAPHFLCNRVFIEISVKHFDEYLFGETHRHKKLGEVSYLVIFYNIIISLFFPQDGFRLHVIFFTTIATYLAI